MTLLEQVKALAQELQIDRPPEFFDGLSETTLGYMLIGMMHINRERKGLDQ